MFKKIRTTIRLNTEILKKAHELGTKLDRSISSLVRLLIEEAYKNEFNVKEKKFARP